MTKKAKTIPKPTVERFEGDLIYVASASVESIAGSRLIIGRSKRELRERFEKALNAENPDEGEALDFVRSFEFYVYNLANEDRVDIEDPSVSPRNFEVDFDFPEM